MVKPVSPPMALPNLQGALWAWVQSLPPWQSDLLRRLTVIDEVDESELRDATRMVLAAFNLTDSTLHVASPVPIPSLVVSPQPLVTKITAVRDLQAVGTVEGGQSLEFSPGLTVVYGETGSGKSSYARVLRKACRSSAKPVEILPNVLKLGPGPNQTRAGTAQIDILQGSTPKVIRRDVNAPPESDLAEISVFDSDCANVYSDEESDIIYTPSSLRLLERLVSFQTQIKKQIEESIARLQLQQVPTDGFDLNSKAGALVAHLTENVNPQIVTALATLSNGEKVKMGKLRQQILTAMTSDPLKVSETLEQRAVAAEHLVELLGSLANGLDDTIVSKLASLNATADKISQESARLSAALSQATTRKVGGTQWKALWQAVHTYLFETGERFPPALDAETAFCPLCEQQLSSEALSRLHQFEEFFRGKVEEQARKVAQERQVILDTLAKLSILEERLSDQVPLIFIGDGVIESSVTAFVKSAMRRRSAVQAGAFASVVHPPPLTTNPCESIKEWISDLRRGASEQKALAAPDAIGKAKLEVLELENRVLLRERRGKVLGRIDTLKQLARLREASAALVTTGLSRRISEFTESAITAQLRAHLVKELGALQCDHLQVSIGARGRKGKILVSIRLDTTRNVQVSDVLSEGERRGVALAFFLAEVATSEHGGGIILDDPVSSLDHSRRSYVAERLLHEAVHRQTIVFTHDVVFLLELQNLADRAKMPCEIRVVRRVGMSTGIASKDLPWVAQNVAKRIGYLKNELQSLSRLELKGDNDNYRKQAKAWFELLREAWERAVEEKLFNGVVGRFQPGIKTLSLASVSVTPAMTAAVESGMSLSSAWAHDQAPADNRPPPKITDIKAALGDLETFITLFRK